jgi:Tol biopolymer transport system component
LRWSPDGRDLIVWARGEGKDGVYTIPQLGGTVRRIAPGRFIACWSPDGTTIAVASYLVGKLWFYDRQGTQQRVISLDGVPWSIWDLDWSAANGLLLLVSSDPQGQYAIWTIRPDGTNQHLVLKDAAEIPTARWARDGHGIYYFRRLNQTDALHKIVIDRDRPEGPQVRTTLLSGLETDRSFALSADEKRLVYARAPYHSNIWTLDRANAAGQWTETKQLTNGTSLIERSSVSPDGRSVLVSIGRETLANLYTLPVSVGPPRPLTTFDAFSVGGAWSPDGQRVAFASTEGGKARVWIVGARGDAARPVSSGRLSESFEVAWSPGPRILYQQAGNQNYYELNPDTGEERLLVKDSSVGWVFSPVYSRDGRYVAVMWSRRPARGIWVIDTITGEERLVYQTSALSARPIGWSPDGSRIYVSEAGKVTYRGLMLPVGETTSDARILTVSLTGGKVQTVAKLPFDEVGTVSMSPDARTFVFSVYSSRSDVWIVDNFDATNARH